MFTGIVEASGTITSIGREPDRGVVRSRVQILNQRDEVCQEGDWLVLMSRNGETA